MSAQQFVEKLRSLGYQKADSVDPSSIEWMFETNSDMIPFLNWFSTSLKPSNVISPEERKKFAELQASGAMILEADQFEDVEQRNDNEQLKKDVLKLRKRKADLLRRKNLLGEQLRSKKNMLVKVENSQANSKQEYKKAVKQTFADNYAKNDSDARLGKSVTQMMELYDTPNKTFQDQTEALFLGQVPLHHHQKVEGRHTPELTKDRKKPFFEKYDSDARLGKSVTEPVKLYDVSKETDWYQEPNRAIFLSQIPLNYIQTVEEEYTKELTRYSKKQFFEGIAQMSGQCDGKRYEMLDISDPESLSVHGENAEAYLQHSKEMSRLKAVYAPSERLRLESGADLAGRKAVLKEIEAILETLDNPSSNKGSATLSYELNEMKRAHQTVWGEIMYQIEEHLPNLLRENTESQVLPIITGDYDLKLARQDYFLSQQDELINYLVDQKARFEFLTMAYELERRSHRDVHRLLAALHCQLVSSEYARQERMSLMEDPRFSDKYQRGTIDSRDAPLLRLHTMLASDSVSPHQLYLQFTNIVEGGDKLGRLLSSTQVKLKHRYGHVFEQLSKLQSSFKKGEALLCPQSHTTGGLPQLTPLPIVKAHGSLEKLLNQLQEAVLDITRSVHEKQSILVRYPTSRAERQIFQFFLDAPDKLEILFRQISQKKRRHTVS